MPQFSARNGSGWFPASRHNTAYRSAAAACEALHTFKFTIDEPAFGSSDYVDHPIRFMEALAHDLHVLAVCQPRVQVLAAVAVTAADGHPAQPRSMTLMAGPVDIRSNPTAVNELSLSKFPSWLERNLISHVPCMHRSAGRCVHPGFAQLSQPSLPITSVTVGKFGSIAEHADSAGHFLPAQYLTVWNIAKQQVATIGKVNGTLGETHAAMKLFKRRTRDDVLSELRLNCHEIRQCDIPFFPMVLRRAPPCRRSRSHRRSFPRS